MDLEVFLESKECKSICEYINGGPHTAFIYRKGSELVVEHLAFDIELSTGPSRWWLTCAAMKQVYDTDGNLNRFFNRYLSIKFIKMNRGLKDSVECAKLVRKAFEDLNNILASTEYEIIKANNNKVIFRKIGSQLVFKGKGGFAEFYIDKDTNLGIKKLKDEFKDDEAIASRFRREYEITSSLSDIKGIIEVYDFNPDELSYSMKIYKQDLDKYISQYNPSLADKYTLILKILDIIEQVHAKDVIHRDLSPHNIFLDEFTNPIIADFGLGKDLKLLHSHQTIDTANQGTFEYCDPRQMRNLQSSDKYSDIYSIGRLINFIMTGKPYNYEHDFRAISRSCTEESIDYRPKDIADLKEKLITTYNAILYFDEELLQQSDKVDKITYEKSINSYLSIIGGMDLVRRLNDSNFLKQYLKFTKDTKNHNIIIDALKTVDYEMENCYYFPFELLDKMGEYCLAIIKSNKYPVEMKSICSKIVENICVKFNRFCIQDKVIEEYVKSVAGTMFLQKTYDWIIEGRQ